LQTVNNAADGSFRLALRVKIDKKKYYNCSQRLYFQLIKKFLSIFMQKAGINIFEMIKRSIHTYRLNGAFDQMDIRKMAYE